jgi:lambda family phage portal protein
MAGFQERKPRRIVQGGQRPPAERFSGVLDRFWRVVSPKHAFQRAQYRMAYDALDGSRTRRKRTNLGGTADKHLTDTSLDGLREIQRDMMRNNPLVEGLLLLEVDEVIGEDYPKIQALTQDTGWNDAAEQLWKDRLVKSPCDVTGRFNVNQLMGLAYLAYRRDGDHVILLTDDGLQSIEGDCIGTPYKLQPQYFDIVNGMAFSRQTGRFLGLYVGKLSEGGYYIDPVSYRRYEAGDVHVVFNPQRPSQSRGEPALKSCITKIDQLDRYIDAELVAANVQACFTMFIAVQDSAKIPGPYIHGTSSTGEDDEGNKLEKLEPGQVHYGRPGETPHGVGMTRPSAVFDSYVTRMLSFITAPLAIPIMMALGDYSSATFMNARFAYMRAQSRWRREQEWVVAPLASRIWRWHVDRMVAEGELARRPDQYVHSVQCRRWPYVDPRVEAAAEDLRLKNGTGNRREYIEARGQDYQEHLEQRAKEKEDFADLDQPPTPKESSNAAE